MIAIVLVICHDPLQSGKGLIERWQLRCPKLGSIIPWQKVKFMKAELIRKTENKKKVGLWSAAVSVCKLLLLLKKTGEFSQCSWHFHVYLVRGKGQTEEEVSPKKNKLYKIDQNCQ